MKYDVKWHETFDIGLRRGTSDATRDHYDLATAIRIVRRMETSEGRGAVFTEIKAKNRVYRLADLLYSSARPMQPLFLFAYMMKSVLSVGPCRTSGTAAVSISNFANEHRAIDRLAALMPEGSLSRLTLNRRHMLSLGQLRAAEQLLKAAPRIWRFLSYLARNHSFMPAARIASVLAFYMWFARYFASQRTTNAAVVPSNYSPEGVGMAAAAHRMNRRVIYINPAPVPANGALVPPVLADCAIFYGEAIRQTYEQRSRCAAKVVLIGQPWTARPMEWRDEIRTVGIFLTALTRTGALADLVASISASHPSARILIRNHPVVLLKADFSDLAARYENVSVTYGNPLDDEIAACDLIVCGNSGVAMNAVSGGRPVAYMNTLDGSGFDYNGFVESGLICHVRAWSEDIYSRLRRFYQTPEWQRVMKSYDASYGADPSKLNQKVAATITRYLQPAQQEAPKRTRLRPPVLLAPEIMQFQ